MEILAVSDQVADAVYRGCTSGRFDDIDLAVTTRQPFSPGGEFLRREQLVWAEAGSSRVHTFETLPLALFPENVCSFRTAALEALELEGRSWRIVCTSRGLAGIRAMVSAGLALTVVTENTLSPDMCIVGEPEGLPPLPTVDLSLHRARSAAGEAVEVFSEHIRASLQPRSMDDREQMAKDSAASGCSSWRS